MTIPSFVAAGAGATDATGGWSYTGAAAGAAGRLMILDVFQSGISATNAITVTSVTNIENLAGTDNVMTGLAVQNVGAVLAGYHFIFFGRSLNTTAPVVTGGNTTADDIYVRMYEFNNVSTGTTLATVLENVTAGGLRNTVGDTLAVADAGVTTRGPNRLALNFICSDENNTIGAMTGMTGGTWAEAVAEYSTLGGTNGMLSLQSANMVSPGTIDDGTVTMGGTVPAWGNIGFALIGASEGVTEIQAPGLASLDAVHRKSVW